MNAKELISYLNLIPHPEGGYYKETYRSNDLSVTNIGNKRNLSTAIYYLLEGLDKSHLHRIQSDELWFFHAGKPLEVVFIENGIWKSIVLGLDLANGEIPQAMIPAGLWFGSHIKEQKGFCLVSCTVAPGFDFNDFEMANRDELSIIYPHLSEKIKLFSK